MQFTSALGILVDKQLIVDHFFLPRVARSVVALIPIIQQGGKQN